MTRKTLLIGVIFLLIAILTACGARATPIPGTESSSSSSGSSGTSPLVVFGLVAVTLLILVNLAISHLGHNKSQTGDSTSTINKNKTSDQAVESQPKRTPATPPAAKKRAALTGNVAGHIFISYRRSDSADIAGRIYDRLTGRFGRNPIFKDVDSIPLGLDFKEYLDAKVSECSVLLAIIGDRWLEASDDTGERRLEDPADFVRIEIESALKGGIPVIPLLVRGAQMPREGKLPDGLKKLAYRNGIPIRPDPDFHRDMDRLITALEKYIP